MTFRTPPLHVQILLGLVLGIVFGLLFSVDQHRVLLTLGSEKSGREVELRQGLRHGAEARPGVSVKTGSIRPSGGPIVGPS